MMTVNGLSLPSDLSALVVTGGWGVGVRPGNLGALPVVDGDDLALLCLPEMVANTNALRAALERGDGALFHVTSEHPPPEGWLNVDRAVMIAATHGQEALVLEYAGHEEPRVLATSAEGWIEVAATFTELLALIKLL